MNKILRDWIAQGIGSTMVCYQITVDDMPKLKEIFEKTIDPTEKIKAKNVIAQILKSGTAYLTVEQVGYMGGDTWKKHPKD
jgi:hypothetical protein